jgi:Peptidase C39 family
LITEAQKRKADEFRCGNGLNTATDNDAWLASRGLSIEGFEAAREDELIAAKRHLHSAQLRQPGLSVRQASHVWIPQLSSGDCGLAALAMVGLRRGLKLSVTELCAKIRPGSKGLSLRQLQTLAEDHGLPCRAVRAPLDRLGELPLPAIAHLSEGHYIVLLELHNGGVVVGDPEVGITTWSVESLAKCASGALLLFKQRGQEPFLISVPDPFA